MKVKLLRHLGLLFPMPLLKFFYLFILYWKKVKVLVTQSCLTLCDPTDCSPPGSSVHGILQARILEWMAISFSRGSYWPRDWTRVSCIAGRLFTVWATREALRSWAEPENSWLYTNSQIYSTATDGASGKEPIYQCWRQGFHWTQLKQLTMHTYHQSLPRCGRAEAKRSTVS